MKTSLIYIWRKLVLLTVVFLAVSGAGFAAEQEGQHVSLMELEEVADLIMSPGCDYKFTLSNCPSTEADQMRELVKDKISGGESTQDILDYFAGVYGPKVLAQPAKKGFYFVAWWFPYFLLFDFVLLLGVFLFIWRRKTDEGSDSGDAKTDPSPDDRLEAQLEQEIREFREQ